MLFSGQACGFWCGLIGDGGYCWLQVACESVGGRVDGRKEADCCELHCVNVWVVVLVLDGREEHVVVPCSVAVVVAVRVKVLCVACDGVTVRSKAASCGW